jgi:hypothetical protein
MGLINPRFSGQPTLEMTLAGNYRIYAGEADSDAVRRIQQALIDLGFVVGATGADGVFGYQTGQAVSQFKIDNNLSPADPVVGKGTMTRLDLLTPYQAPNNDQPPSADEIYVANRAKFHNLALRKTFGEQVPPWDPDKGFEENRQTITSVYNYYLSTFLLRPETFLWAGLGRMAGGAVVNGLQNLSLVAGRGHLEKTLVRIGKEIFFDLAWQHEAYLEEPALAIKLGYLHDERVKFARYDGNQTPTYRHAGPLESYGRAWADLDSGDPLGAIKGNLALLANEQWSIIQPHYDFLNSDNPGLGETWLFERSGAFADSIHPYHRAFLYVVPEGAVGVAVDRWRWINEPDGMYDKWARLGAAERVRLASLSFDDLINRRFGIPGRPELLPPGSQ